MSFKEKFFNILNMEIGNKLNLLDLSISLKEAGLLLKSNINTAETINLLSKTSPNKTLKKIFAEVYENLLKGFDLYQSFSETKKFDNLFLSLIKSGESSEKLSEVFLYLSLYYEKKYKLKQKLISIMTYPIILLFVTFVVLVFLLNNVIPMFLEIFEDSNVELPKVTKFLVKSTNFVKQNYLYIILGILIFVIFIKFISKKYAVRKFFGKMLFKIPYIKGHYQNYITSIVAKNLTILLNGNISIVEALEIVKNSTRNIFISEHLEVAILKIKSGKLISNSLKDDLIFNLAFINMLAIGENSENLVEILESATEYYDQKINYSVDKILQYLQPIIIIFNFTLCCIYRLFNSNTDFRLVERNKYRIDNKKATIFFVAFVFFLIFFDYFSFISAKIFLMSVKISS